MKTVLINENSLDKCRNSACLQDIRNSACLEYICSKPVLPQEYSIAVPGASICRNLLVFKVCSVPGWRELILWFSFYHRLFTCLCYDFDIRKGNSGIFHRSL